MRFCNTATGAEAGDNVASDTGAKGFVVVVMELAIVATVVVDGTDASSMMLLLFVVILASIQPEARMVHTAVMAFRIVFLVGRGMRVVRVVVMLREEAESNSI